MKKKPDHILRTQQFDRPLLETLFTEVDDINVKLRDPRECDQLRLSLLHRSLIVHFYVHSSRTRTSFVRAGQLLGMDVTSTQSAGEFSANLSRENVEESIRVLAGWKTDVIVVRHSDNSGADRAAEVVDAAGLPTRIINGGCGTGQHPTQSLIDLYALTRLGNDRNIDGMTILIAGNLAFGRTVRSLAYLLSRYRVKLLFLSPVELKLGDDILLHLREHGVEYEVHHDPKDVLRHADAIYWTNFNDGNPRPITTASCSGTYSMALTGPLMNLVKKDAFVLHPLPIGDEISKEAKEDPRMKFFEQSDFSVPVRMALLLRLFASRPQ